LTESAVNAFRHVNVVDRSTARSIGPLFCLDVDGLCRADGFAQLARNAPTTDEDGTEMTSHDEPFRMRVRIKDRVKVKVKVKVGLRLGWD
jgi:hypothetical protein